MRSSSRSFQDAILVSAMSRHRFHHNSMRAQQILDIIEWLDRAHFELQNEASFVWFGGWVQMLFDCKVEQSAIHRNLIRFSPNPEALQGIFLKKFTGKLVYKYKRKQDLQCVHLS